MSLQSDYESFLASKRATVQPKGFKATRLPKQLFAYQRDIVRWACGLGRAAIWAGCGLGKTLMQLAWADQVRRQTGGNVLILCPLAVTPQTVKEADDFGFKNVKAFAEDGTGIDAGKPTIVVTNYHKLLKLKVRPEDFAGVVLDESSILKSFMGATKRALCDAFASHQYKLVCTATPAPNDHMEIGNHAEFLGVMGSGEMLARWFLADQSHVGHYKLKGHAEADYWRWVSGWAVCLDRPSDIGYTDDARHHLPTLDVRQHVVAVDATDGAASGEFWRNDKLTATSLQGELRRTADARAAKVAEIVAADPGESWAIWCNTDYEADALVAAIPGAVEVRGSMPDRMKEERLSGFTDRTIRVLVTKPTIAGFGLNWQHCARTAFVGLSYSYEQFYQAVRRLWRFGQARTVEAHIVTAETEGDVWATHRRKEEANEKLRASLVKACCESLKQKETPLIDVPHEVKAGKSWTLHLGDNVRQIAHVQNDSVGLTVFSPPFSNLYIYSDAEADMGNSADDEEFFRHFGYLVPELLRVTIPGRLCAVHCKDLPTYANRDGIAGLKDFPGEITRLFVSHGWSYHSRVTIWKCPVTERERTNNNGLLHKTVMRDSSQIRQGMADYLLVFRKRPAEGDGLMSSNPIERPDGLDRWIGDAASDPRSTDGHASPYARTARKAEADPSILLWRRYAEPVWWDIDQMDVLNAKEGTSEKDERHICPLQLGLIRRVVWLWSHPGDLVLSPFAGIGSEGVVALEEKRRFVGIELKRSYWDRASRHLDAAERRASQGNLFGELPEEAA